MDVGVWIFGKGWEGGKKALTRNAEALPKIFVQGSLQCRGFGGLAFLQFSSYRLSEVGDQKKRFDMSPSHCTRTERELRF